MKNYTITELSRLANVSTRTLRYYDEINLLKPSDRLIGGERLYTKQELLRLQQILFYREMDLSLINVKNILDSKDFNILSALENHRLVLKEQSKRTNTLLETVENTILYLKGNNKMLSDDDLYEGFSKEQMKTYEIEANDKWGPMVADVNVKVRQWSKEKLDSVKQEGITINTLLSELMDMDASDPQVQKLMHRHFLLISNFYEPTYEIYKGLAEMYISDERFTQYYDQHKVGLANFMKKGMDEYAEKNLK